MLQTMNRINTINDLAIEVLQIEADSVLELKNRIIHDNMDIIRECKKIHNSCDMDILDDIIYNDINSLRIELMKDTLSRKSLFTQIIDALDNNELDKASNLQLIMKEKMESLQSKYIQYKKNIF